MTNAGGIEIRGVRHAFGDRVVLDGIDLSLTEGRIGLVGANGSGKSTLVRMLNGLVVPDAGQVLVDGLDVRRQAKAVRRRVGFVFTDPDAQIVMPTVGEDVALSLRRSGLDERAQAARVSATLEHFGLAEYAEHPAHLLSGGQKQLLAIAAVLVSEPAVLVCDEPTTLLDLPNTRRVMRLLAGLEQQLVVVSHDLTVFDDFDRVIALDRGRVLADGPPEHSLAAYVQQVGASG